MIRVCLAGIGKTGAEVAKYFLGNNQVKLVAAICSPGSSKKGKDLGEVIGCSKTGLIIESSDNLEEIIFRTRPEVVVDFSKPEATLRNARIFSRMRVNMVIATTGFTKLALKKLFVIARRHQNGIVYAPNITLGVNVMMLITNIAANLLSDYDFQITEIHHNKKKDSPSGTALKIAKEIQKGLQSSGKDISESDIPISSIRAGGVVGKHEVLIVGEEDKIEITHESFSRKVFAVGALKAVKFIHKKTGYYEMSDVLDLDKALSDYTKSIGSNSAGKQGTVIKL